MNAPTHIRRTPSGRTRDLPPVVLVAAALLAACLLALVGTPEPAGAAFPGENGRIAFTQDYNISTMNPDGTVITQLPLYGISPVWSPDNTKIAFVSNDGFLTTINRDGTGVSRLTEAWTDPTWSPDGSKIAYTTLTSSTGVSSIWTINVDGTGKTPLVTDTYTRNGWPAWSPNGDKIAFASQPDGVGDYDIYTVNADGTGLNQLTTSTADENLPAW